MTGGPRGRLDAGARLVAGLVGLAMVVTACAVPQRRDTSVVTKVAANDPAARSIVAHFNVVRQRADQNLDGSLLAQVEGGGLLDVDQGAYFVSARVAGRDEQPAVSLAPPEEVLAPRFDTYPLWFVVLARDRTSGNKRVAVFERADSVAPWLMTMAPATTPTAGLPEVATDHTGAVVPVGPQDRSGTGVSAVEVLQQYATALTPGSSEQDRFAPDAFLRQTGRFQQSQSSLPFASFEQSWTAETPRFVLRLENGGLLVFGSLTRTDSYSVESNSYIDWDDNADTAAYLPGRVFQSAILDYSHQLLLLVPPRGAGKPRLIGQYGGVVDGRGS